MKISFINPPFKTEYGKFTRESRSPAIGHSGVLYYPLWLIYAAALIEENGFDIFFYDACAKRTDFNETLNIIDKSAPNTRLFVLDTSTPSIYSDISFGEKLKERYPGSFILLVGTHPTATVEETLNTSGKIDGIARKEYDFTVMNLASALHDNADLTEVKGLSFRKGTEIINNPDADYVMDLDIIPFASKFINNHLNIRDYFFAAAAFPSIQIFTGRGCPARCNFCVYPQTMHGHKYRLRSVSNVVDEFEYIVKNIKGVKEIVIEDDTFTADKKRTIEICNELIRRKIKVRWLCNARANLDYETMKIMKKAGCHLVIPGIESFNQAVLNNIKKGTTLKQIEDFIKNTKKAGLLVHACYMVGNKGETKQTMQDTLNAALKFNTDTAQFYPLIPYPGTEAYEWAKTNEYISGKYDDYCKEDGSLNSVLNLPNISSDEMTSFCAMARKKYYLRVSYFLHRIIRGLTDFQDFKRSLKAFGKLKHSLFKKN